ncbi:MAG: hypothetical protein K6D59_10580 [Bacteroidales bacterium]|nr:hypothetical protein [Bacteroidales bacterium]
MKKILFFASLFLVAYSYGQNTMELQPTGAIVSGTSHVARVSYDNINTVDYAVSYTGDVNDRGFLWSDQSLNGRYFSISDTNIHVNDLTILNDIVYFCGHNTDGEAVVGRFKVQDFQLSTATLQYIAISYLNLNNIDPITSFTKIKAYYDDDMQKVVLALVGKNQDIQNPSSNNSYLVIIIDGGNSFDYRYYKPNNPSQSEYHCIEDVVITKKYVVAVGGEYSTERQGRLYRVKKTDIQMNNYYYDEYIITDPDNNTFTSTAVVECLKDDEIAFACLRNYWGNNNTDMRVYTFDMDALQFLNVQDIPLVGKCSPKELLYMPCDGSLLMLIWDGYYGNVNTPASLVYYLNPYSSGYTADYIYETDEAIRSIDRFADLTRFLMGGNDGSGLTKYWIRNKLAGTSGICIKYDQIYVKQADTPSISSNTYNGSSNQDPLSTIEFIPVDESIYPGCKE